MATDGTRIVADTNNRRISLFDRSSEGWRIVELNRGSPASVCYPDLIVVLPDGRILAWLHGEAALYLIEGAAPHRIERLVAPDLAGTTCWHVVLADGPDTLLLVDGPGRRLMGCRLRASFAEDAPIPQADVTTNETELW